MGRQILTRRLVLWAALAIGVFLASMVATSLAVHAYGAHRLTASQATFAERWGQYILPPPAAVPTDRANGARFMVLGGRAMTSSVDEHRFIAELSGRPAASWSDADTDRAREILGEQQTALSILLQSRTADGFDLGIENRPPNYNDIDFLALVRGLRLLTLEARLAWAEGRVEDGLAAIETASRSADGLLRTPVIMSLTLGAAAQRWVLSAAKDIVGDPCAGSTVLDGLARRLPAEPAVRSAIGTFVTSVAELAEQGLAYRDDVNDPSVSWSLPYWISNHFLFEDLLIAEILDRWNRQIELGLHPAAGWSRETADSIWGGRWWPSGLALNGAYSANLTGVWVRAQAADTEHQQVAFALELRRRSPAGLTRDACRAVAEASPTPLTGQPVVCRADPSGQSLVIDVPDAEATLVRHSALDNDSARFEPIILSVGPRPDSCQKPAATE
ncbi:MAG: hypothetical protein PVG53_02095 [Holophagae bacterium]